MLSGCDDLSLGHKNHVVRISTPCSVESSPGNISVGELARNNKEWGRSIDRYVASVLDTTNNSRKSGEATPASPHPDNHILSYLGKTSALSRSVDTNGFIDDVSFEPLRPFEAFRDPPLKSKTERIEQHMKKHWKAITAACLVVVLVFAVSLGTSKLRNKHHDNKPGSNAVGTPVARIVYPTESPTTATPTYSPTMQSTTNAPGALSASPNTMAPTLKSSTAHPIDFPTRTQTTAPTHLPTNRPTMVTEYYQMLKAAKYVSGSRERSGSEGEDPFDDFSSPQSLAFHWLYFEGSPSRNVFEFFEQYAVAVVFFSLTEIRQSSWSNNSLPQDGFITIRQPCGWNGIRCAYNSTTNITHVTEIILPMRGLTGPIPKEIGFLPYLTKLDLADNEIVGTIPDEIYGLTNLR
jgi:hypothetical protein